MMLTSMWDLLESSRIL